MLSRLGQEIDQLVVSVFQLNGVLLAAGDQITAPFGLTSARWQVLGALAFSAHALTIPQIAKDMGLSRQAVIKQIKLLAVDGLVQSQSNEAHKRAELWSLTPAGREKYEDIMTSQRALAQVWRKGLTLAELAECSRVLKHLEAAVQQASNARRPSLAGARTLERKARR